MIRELIVDNFAGGGGASTGIEMALGRSVDVAINHDAEAIAMHAANHPATRHYCEDVFSVDPVAVAAGRPIGLAHFSPDCKHFSKAKGGKPKCRKIRGLAWVMVKWAAMVKPRVMILENVEEFKTWGPLLGDGTIAQRRNVCGSTMWGPQNKFAVHTASGIPIDFFATDEASFWGYLVCRTGGKLNNVQICNAARAQGWMWNPTNGQFSRPAGLTRELHPITSERAVFDFVGLPYLEPWERQ